MNLLFHHTNVVLFLYVEQDYIYFCKYINYVLVHGKKPSSKGRRFSVLKERYFVYAATVLEKTLEQLQEYDLSS